MYSLGSYTSTTHVMPTIKQSPLASLHLTQFNFRVRRPRLTASSKKSTFQDFQEYAKPKRVFPTKGLNFNGDGLEFDGTHSLYKVLLRTSSMYGSDLSDPNSGILLCVIDENGDSVLERIPSIIQRSDDDLSSDAIRFQRGSTDEYFFWGPNLERILAMWISLDSGSWRLGGASLTIICASNHLKGDSTSNGNIYCSVTYTFEVEDVMLGERSDFEMVELRPCLVTEHFRDDSVSFIDATSSQAVSHTEKGIRNEDTMREYSDLKYSLLLYDSMLIFAGTSITLLAGGKTTALAFFIGGIGGFLYLLFLQRSVDSLPAPESIVKDKASDFNGLFGGLKGPILVFASAFAIAFLATKHNESEAIMSLTPREILVGMVGFLACKVSVVMAALKPMSVGMEDND